MDNISYKWPADTRFVYWVQRVYSARERSMPLGPYRDRHEPFSTNLPDSMM